MLTEQTNSTIDKQIRPAPTSLALQVVGEPVDFRRPRPRVRLVELLLEELERLVVCLVDAESLAQVLDVLDVLQFRNAAREHHDEERDEQVGVLAQHHERTPAQLLKAASTTTGTKH